MQKERTHYVQIYFWSPITFIFEQQSKGMQDREEFPQPVFSVKDCELNELNGKYFVDTAENNGFRNGKHCYQKDGPGDDGGECTVYHNGVSGWFASKYDIAHYWVASNDDQPPTNGWRDSIDGDSALELVYGVSDVSKFYV